MSVLKIINYHGFKFPFRIKNGNGEIVFAFIIYVAFSYKVKKESILAFWEIAIHGYFVGPWNTIFYSNLF